VSRRIGVVGVPTSAGAFAPGQENAPRALREAGLVERLRDRGLEVRDHGDRERWRWRPDRANPRAQNLEKVVEIVGDTAHRVAAAADSGELTLVLGGDCTAGVGTVAGHSADRQPPGVIYFDAHADLALFGYVHVADEGGLEMDRFPAVRRWIERVTRQPRFMNDLEPIPESARAEESRSIYDA
jgi:arginase family enzyme